MQISTSLSIAHVHLAKKSNQEKYGKCHLPVGMKHLLDGTISLLQGLEAY